MTESVTTSRREQDRGPRRLELRLSPSEFKRLERAAKSNFRSPVSEARYLILRGLDAERPVGGRRDS